MSAQPGSGPILVYTQRLLAQMLAHLSQQRILALDTESNSLYSYYPKVCLIQISAPAEIDSGNPLSVVDYLVDTVRITALDGLGTVLANPAVEVVMHAAENDMLLLHRSFGIHFGRVFDTQLAARILGWDQVGLAAILEEHFGVVSDKRMQRTNWGKRPLTPQQIAYAQMDTHYLLALRNQLIEELKESARWEEAQDAFALLARNNYADRIAEERTFWQMKCVRTLPPSHLAVLEALWLWREDEARRQNRPPFKIITDAELADLATELPATIAALGDLVSLGERHQERYGAELLHIIEEARHHPPPEPREVVLRPEHALEKAALNRYDALRKWRSERARVRGVAPDIVLNNATLLNIAQHKPSTAQDLAQVADIGAWKMRTYGPEILEILQTTK
ncbi:MAG: ribonuclease D [Caldilineaceae bacterium]|nr:ribonuclease D [Caldilineaceae bacterium]